MMSIGFLDDLPFSFMYDIASKKEAEKAEKDINKYKKGPSVSFLHPGNMKLNGPSTFQSHITT